MHLTYFDFSKKMIKSSTYISIPQNLMRWKFNKNLNIQSDCKNLIILICILC